MKEASAELEFEKAAKLRDQITALDSVLEQNAVVFSSDVDADIIGIDTDELEASVHTFFVRAGTIRGERGWSVERVEDVTNAQLLSDLITQVYSAAVEEQAGDRTSEQGLAAIKVSENRSALAPTQQATATDSMSRAQATKQRREREEMTGRNDLLSPISPIPREIIVPFIPDRVDDLEQWLSTLRGSSVTIRVAERGEKKTLLDRATANAQQSLKRAKSSRVTDLAARSEALNDIADALMLDKAPLRIECFDI